MSDPSRAGRIRKRIAAGLIIAFGLAGCAGVIDTAPVNLPAAQPQALSADRDRPSTQPPDGVIIGLAFSGGGTRAAAFAYGVLHGLEAAPAPGGTLLDRVRFVSGVSGGSITAAYFGLKGRAAFADFGDRFLYRNAEEGLRTDVSVSNLLRGLSGGVNDKTGFPLWLRANLFGNATFADLYRPGNPAIWINASDIYSKTPFVFTSLTFGAICSDLANYPIAEAVAASAAVPVVFAPVVVEAYSDKCDFKIPQRLVTAAAKRDGSANVKAFVDALQLYRTPGGARYVKLLDGGLTDNWGLQGLTVSLASEEEPWRPMRREDAIRLRRLVFLVADAGRATDASWTQTIEGPSGADLLNAVTDTAIDSAVRSSYDFFRVEIEAWEERLRAWRCRLPAAAIAAARRENPRWACRDVAIDVVRLSFSDLGPDRAAALGQVPTRFKLPPEMVTATVEAGRDATTKALAGLGLR